MRKSLNMEQIRDILDTISMIVTIADLKEIDLRKGSLLQFDDYEDALQCACAQRVKADCIVTRNPKDFKNSAVQVMEPQELLQWVRMNTQPLKN